MDIFKHLDLLWFDADGKSDPKIKILLPNGGEIHGDESHGIESVKNHQKNKSKRNIYGLKRNSLRLTSITSSFGQAKNWLPFTGI